MALFYIILFLLGFVFGAVLIIALEALGVIFFINRLNCKAKEEENAAEESKRKSVQLDSHESLTYAYNKEGIIWILEPDKVPKISSVDKVPKDQTRKKEFLEVFPVKRYAKIKHQSLILIGGDDSDIVIPLKGCIIEAVSATSLSSRKWAKRFPIKVENEVSFVYKGSKTVYIYLETSWEKESWCKALRIASCDDKERLNWFAELNENFNSYLTSLKTGYPSFMKPTVEIYSEPIEGRDRTDGSTSKVRLLWKKLSKKAAKAGEEYKSTWTSSSGREERKTNEKYLKHQDSVSAKAPFNIFYDDVISSPSRSQSQISGISDADFDDKFNVDEGTLCWNLLISRLFFDAKSNKEFKRPIQERIQRTLSNMRIPSYVGELTCTDIHLGNLPPYIHGMRVLPLDMNEVWALEIDIEYLGGALLDVGTRLEVRDLDIQKGLLDGSLEASPVVDASSDLLESIEDYGRKQLNLSEGSVEGVEQKDEAEKVGLKSSKSTVPTLTSVYRWKSILSSVAKQVSQVPLSLSIRVASLRGTLRLHIKPPPSDQLWFGFVSMPDIDFKLECSVGEQKITSGHIALLLITRFKAAIRETLVLPNCESVCMPWMLAEKHDWIPRKVVPFMWVHQDTTHVNESSGFQTNEMKTKKEASRGISSDHGEHKSKKVEKSVGNVNPRREPEDTLCPLPRSKTPCPQKNTSSQDLKSLGDKPSLKTCHLDGEELELKSSSRSSVSSDGENHIPEGDDGRQKRMGRRARMFDLGKKMGEKLEEKRRHIEEKGKTIVEKMRGP